MQGLLFNIILWIVIDLMVLGKIDNDYLSNLWLVYQVVYVTLAFIQMVCLYYLSKKLIGEMDENVTTDIIL